MLAIIISIALIITSCGCETTGPEVGKKAPDFTLENLDGESITLSELQGKIVVVNFWQKRCVPCKEEMPLLQAIHDKWKNEDVVVLTINIREDTETIKEFINGKEYTFPVLFDSQSEVAGQYLIEFIPMTFFIDDKGTIKVIKVGAFRSQSEIENIIDSL